MLRTSWADLGAGSDRPVVVRSSSTVEDASQSSMAGRFRSILGVTSWDGFVHALTVVRGSASAVLDDDGATGPMAILVQRQLDAFHGGVVFGVDPVDGDARHVVVDVVPGNPDALVSGRATATHLVLSRRGRVLERRGSSVTVSRRERRGLVALSARADVVFRAPQDIEWAVARDGVLHLLQSRPVTAVGGGAGQGPVLGPGPVAETFPEPLSPLEEDVWLEPLGRGIRSALRVSRAVPHSRAAKAVPVRTVGGWAAADLELLGYRRPVARRLGPLSGARRLAAAWSVGRLRVAPPTLAADLVAHIDDELADVPPLAALATAELVDVVENAADALASAHGYEVLAGMLLGRDAAATPAGVVALSVLARGRNLGLADAALIEREPVVLSLVPPRFGGTHELPAGLRAPLAGPAASLDVRDVLRLRCRWLQELGGRALGELGRRLAEGGPLRRPEDLRGLRLEELRAVAAGGDLPPDLEARRWVGAGPPLPEAFRLTPTGVAVAVPSRGASHQRIGAGGGRATGTVCHTAADLPSLDGGRAVLVVGTLDPSLAPVLPSLAGLVAETGSVLSHVAILARELGIATVVAVPAARSRFRPGRLVVVDGTTGEVAALTDREEAR